MNARRYAGYAIAFALIMPVSASADVVLPRIPANPTIADLQEVIRQLTIIVNDLVAQRASARAVPPAAATVPEPVASEAQPQVPGTVAATLVAPETPVAPSTSPVPNPVCAAVSAIDQIRAIANGGQLCKGGTSIYQWVPPGAGSIPLFPTPASCKTPWGNIDVRSGQLVDFDPYFSNGARPAVPTTAKKLCENGVWQTVQSVDIAGWYASATNRNIVAAGADIMCKTPWGNLTVQNGQTVSYEPYFSYGMRTAGFPNVRVQCVSGVWINVYDTGAGAPDPYGR